MKRYFILLSVILTVACFGNKNVGNNRYDVQNQRAQEAFEELDSQTGGKSETEKELEKMEEEMREKAHPAAGIGKKPDTAGTKEPASKYPEKKRPESVSEKNIPDSDYPLKNGKPAWFYDSTYEGYLGAVGIARKSSVRGGFEAQKRLAKTLAQAELAKMINVVVDTELKTERVQISSDVYSHYKSKLSTLSVHSAEEIINDAVVKDIWVEKDTGDLYLWLVIEK